MIDELILNVEQLRCLASPVRNDVLTRLRLLGEASAREVAEALGRSPASVHYHLLALVEAGLVEEAYRKPSPRKPESFYRSAARRLILPKAEDRDAEVQQATRQTLLAQLRRLAREYEDAFDRAEASPEIRPAMQFITYATRLSPADLETFKQKVRDLAEFAETHRTDDGLPVRWSSIIHPI